MKVLFGAFFMCLILAYSEADLYPIRLWPGTEKKEMYAGDESAETKIDENQFCQGKANGLYTHDSLHCQDFFNCDNETSHVQTCPSSTYFDSITRECNYTWAVECGVRPTVVHQILMVGSCLDTFNGSYVTGTIRNKQNCSEYSVCDEGKSAKRVCPNKSIYNMNLSIPGVCIENDGSDPACPQTISSASREPVFEPVKLFD